MKRRTRIFVEWDEMYFVHDRKTKFQIRKLIKEPNRMRVIVWKQCGSLNNVYQIDVV